MFGLLRRASCQNNPHPTRMVRPFLEALESRYCPSTSTSTLSLNVSYAANRQVTLSGQLTNTGTLGGQTIRITGAVATTATTDANGNYTVTLTASQLGEVDAQTADNQSNVAINNLTASTPTITQFGAVKGDLNYWTFSGKVVGDVTQGMVITFDGNVNAMKGKTTTVDANGWFNITVAIDPSDYGMVSAKATDWWGIYSGVVYTLIHN